MMMFLSMLQFSVGFWCVLMYYSFYNTDNTLIKVLSFIGSSLLVVPAFFNIMKYWEKVMNKN
jgi:hypothetical protein